MVSETPQQPRYLRLSHEAFLRAGQIGANAVAVLAALAYHANEYRMCWPSVTTIAREAGCSISTARRTIRSLEAAELIDTVGRRYVGGQDPIHYAEESDFAESQPGRRLSSVYTIRDGLDRARLQRDVEAARNVERHSKDSVPPEDPRRSSKTAPLVSTYGQSDRGEMRSERPDPPVRATEKQEPSRAHRARGGAPTTTENGSMKLDSLGDAGRARREARSTPRCRPSEAGTDTMAQRIAAYAEAAGHDPEAYAAGRLRDDARRAFRSVPVGSTPADVAGCARWMLTGWHGKAAGRLTPAAVARDLPEWIVSGRPIQKSERDGPGRSQ